MSSFFSELEQRKVYRVAAAYIIAAGFIISNRLRSADCNRHPFRCNRFYFWHRSWAVPRDICFVFRTPVAKLAHQRAQSLTIFSQRIFHPKRHFVENLSSDDTVAFQLAQMLGQHLSRNSRNGPLQFEKTTNAAFTEMPKD
jgi:hypothetical protein